mmetsp:Transcript_5128/g.15537  ORF Transcript_5128/g.15537 Transcript_5128/m.15537 type:complete len:509 (+) Transcript_5128:107-1633(+)
MAELEPVRGEREPVVDGVDHGCDGVAESDGGRRGDEPGGFGVQQRGAGRQLAAVWVVRARGVHLSLGRRRLSRGEHGAVSRLCGDDEQSPRARADGGVVHEQLHLPGPLWGEGVPRRDGRDVLPRRRGGADRVWVRRREAGQLRGAARPRRLGAVPECLADADPDRELSLGRHESERDLVSVSLLPNLERRPGRVRLGAQELGHYLSPRASELVAPGLLGLPRHARSRLLERPGRRPRPGPLARRDPDPLRLVGRRLQPARPLHGRHQRHRDGPVLGPHRQSRDHRHQPGLGGRLGHAVRLLETQRLALRLRPLPAHLREHPLPRLADALQARRPHRHRRSPHQLRLKRHRPPTRLRRRSPRSVPDPMQSPRRLQPDRPRPLQRLVPCHHPFSRRRLLPHRAGGLAPSALPPTGLLVARSRLEDAPTTTREPHEVRKTSRATLDDEPLLSFGVGSFRAISPSTERHTPRMPSGWHFDYLSPQIKPAGSTGCHRPTPPTDLTETRSTAL